MIYILEKRKKNFSYCTYPQITYVATTYTEQRERERDRERKKLREKKYEKKENQIKKQTKPYNKIQTRGNSHNEQQQPPER